MNEFISFSALLNGVEVRLTMKIKDLDIVTRDNTEKFNVENDSHLLTEIEFEDIY